MALKYPMELKSVCKDYLWGGTKLKAYYNKESEYQNVAESWELCCHAQGNSTIQNGEYQNKELADYLEMSDYEEAGKSVAGQKFPLLTKLIDTVDNLSVQVHPNDEYALKHENQPGKTEFWYVIDCEPDACLYYGFSKAIDKEEFIKRSKDGTITEVLNSVSVKPGDVFLVKPGTVHAIGKNITIAEIGTNCNVTYRIYDYNRKDSDGNTRPLHIKQASDVAYLDKPCRYSFNEDSVIDCGTFVVEKQAVKTSRTIEASDDTFHHILCVDGDGHIIAGNKELAFRKGSSIFIPAGMGKYQVIGSCELLITTCK